MEEKKTDGGGLLGTRTSYKPFAYPWAYEAFMQSEQMHWLWTEVPMIEDVKDYQQKLTDSERDFLTKILRFFTQGDIDVSGAYVNSYLPRFRQPELRMMLSSFAAREAVHIAAYSHLIETLGLPESIYNEFLEYEAMAAKHSFFSEVEKDEKNLAAQIAAFSAFTEGMQLFSSFVMLLNFTRNGTMKGMGQIIAWSIADETLHTESMTRIFREYIKENPALWTDELKARIYGIAETMVDLEDRFIDLAFGVSEMKRLTREDVRAYIRYIADRRLTGLGMKGIFRSGKNPLPWVDAMLGVSHTNFFENRVVDYAKGALTGDWGDVWGKAGK
ncbi:ribonucleotide-diphosphate reductase subunit beta [Sutterella sp.]|uniref:ribonucleotide-diphosphate reductase subunit beta n=1 Tax=Sutterella sp. TaxID=1981025 RepID=UPI0026E0F9F7|nr:ribonucleotide-diphosphate reductase subunit beta [Sutterella sp.]MDO5532498.1 ribonucleotide-diphosphate reductase subunit beta [Sutterella sp.]